MAIPFVQIGQCGNQVGAELYETVWDDLLSIGPAQARAFPGYEAISRERFFSENESGACFARAVMVDMEEKVVTAVKQKRHNWAYPADSSLTEKRGSGNNWAAGYCGHGPRVEGRAVELMRKQIEACDRLDGIIAVMSLAGGTGSGLGTRLCSALREAFPEVALAAQLVWPFTRGEVSIQAYNAVLSLAHLQASTDGLLLFENDVLHDICRRRLGLANVTMTQLNQLIGHQVASFLQPVEGVSRPLSDLLGHTAAHSDYKLLQLRTIPYMSERCREFATDQWPQLTKHLRQMMLADAPMEDGVDWSVKLSSKRSTQVASLLTLRGRDAITASTTAFTEDRLFAAWVRSLPSHSACDLWTQSRPFRQYPRSAGLLTNGQMCVPALDAVVGQAWRMFASKAFVHQYTTHGFSEADFLDAFASIEQLIYNYKSLSE